MNKWLDCIKGDALSGDLGSDKATGSPRKSTTSESLSEKPSHREAPAAPVAASAPTPAPTSAQAPAPAPAAKDSKEKKDKKKRSLFGKKR